MSDFERKLLLTAPGAAKGERLDRFLAGEIEEISRNAVIHLIRRGRVRVNGEKTKAHYTIKGGETIDVWIVPPEPLSVEPEEIPLDVVYEDNHLIVINKPPGLVTHPSRGHERGTLVNALVHHCGSLPQPEGIDEGEEESADAVARPGIVHRLDGDTSGLIVAAKTPHSLWKLCEQFAARTVTKSYMALVHGRPAKPSGRISGPIGRNPKLRKKMAVRREPGQGKDATTDYESVAQWRVDVRRRSAVWFSCIRARPKTGRTHQIRVHLASIGCPLLADPLYGKEESIGAREVYGRHVPDGADPAPVLARHALHAESLAFDHPETGERMSFDAPLAADLAAAQELIARAAADFTA